MADIATLEAEMETVAAERTDNPTPVELSIEMDSHARGPAVNITREESRYDFNKVTSDWVRAAMRAGYIVAATMKRNDTEMRLFLAEPEGMPELGSAYPMSVDEAQEYLNSNNDFVGGVVEASGGGDLYVADGTTDIDDIDMPDGWSARKAFAGFEFYRGDNPHEVDDHEELIEYLREHNDKAYVSGYVPDINGVFAGAECGDGQPRKFADLNIPDNAVQKKGSSYGCYIWLEGGKKPSGTE